VIAYDTAAAYQFGQLKQELKNQPIGPYDLMIAAHARSLGLTLNNQQHKRIWACCRIKSGKLGFD
jgi:predicted nucleic acid-binding protein